MVHGGRVCGFVDVVWSALVPEAQLLRYLREGAAARTSMGESGRPGRESPNIASNSPAERLF